MNLGSKRGKKKWRKVVRQIGGGPVKENLPRATVKTNLKLGKDEPLVLTKRWVDYP